jgi:hypothetical protein
MHRNSTHRIAALTVCALLATFCANTRAHAQQASSQSACKAEQFAALIDGTGQYLREFALSRRPQLHKKFDKIAQQRGWQPASAQERGYQLVQDDKVADLDARARKLVIELDQIDADTGAGPACARLEHLRKVTLELRAVTEAKFNHMMQLADRAMNTASPVKPSAAPPASPPTTSAPPPAAPTTPPAPRPALSNPASLTPASPIPASPTPASPGVPPWQTTTEGTGQPTPPVRSQLPPPRQLPVNTTYSAAEIRDAGRGFFGNISAGLASVIQYTFQQYGAPNGYILGSEGGGAFLAGISYGEGHLTMKSTAPIKVYWQGPSVGYDLGVQGGRVMFLVYNLEQPEQVFHRFAGIGGSAYVVGGAGLTYHKRGDIVLAPIRTGLGLRLGANIGYLKFTPRFSINPF